MEPSAVAWVTVAVLDLADVAAVDFKVSAEVVPPARVVEIVESTPE